MTDQPGEDHLYAQMVRAIDRLGDLPARQEQERAELQTEIRAGLNQVMTAERNTKDAVSDAHRQLDALVGRAGRLLARSGVAQNAVTPPASQQLPRRVSEFARAIDGAHHDLKAAESSWDWVERARTSAARALSAAVEEPIRPVAPLVEEPGEESPSRRKGCVGRVAAMFGNAALLTALVAWVRR